MELSLMWHFPYHVLPGVASSIQICAEDGCVWGRLVILGTEVRELKKEDAHYFISIHV